VKFSLNKPPIFLWVPNFLSSVLFSTMSILSTPTRNIWCHHVHYPYRLSFHFPTYYFTGFNNKLLTCSIVFCFMKPRSDALYSHWMYWANVRVVSEINALIAVRMLLQLTNLPRPAKSWHSLVCPGVGTDIMIQNVIEHDLIFLINLNSYNRCWRAIT
jgi:hypothetical protein